ncbi:MAG: cell division protein FtsW [Ruminococcaceae bacterium]|nr:cell division protein FtsW [Oscillospiraceae bacterium]
MKKLGNKITEIFKKGDMILLSLCIIATIFGIVMIYAVTQDEGTHYITVQIGAMLAGIVLYFLLTAFDIDILAGQRSLLFLFNAGFIGILLIWGIEGSSGNRSWLDFPFLPFNIQPAEVCKITYIIILAKTMSIHQNRISSLRSVSPLVFHMLFIVGLIIMISSDTGVALIFVFIFITMLFIGGVSLWWFLCGAGIVALATPYIWLNILRPDQKNRILALFDPSIDPSGRNTLWQTNQSLKALQNGGISGMGLFEGNLSEAGLPAKHTDMIFSSTGEQLGMLGCLFILAILTAIVARIIYVGIKSPDYMNRLICLGIASMLLFQILINIGVCLGLVPVIGLALPFISYGGSSILTSFIAMGVVSGIKMRPSREISAHYIRPY